MFFSKKTENCNISRIVEILFFLIRSATLWASFLSVTTIVLSSSLALSNTSTLLIPYRLLLSVQLVTRISFKYINNSLNVSFGMTVGSNMCLMSQIYNESGEYQLYLFILLKLPIFSVISPTFQILKCSLLSREGFFLFLPSLLFSLSN